MACSIAIFVLGRFKMGPISLPSWRAAEQQLQICLMMHAIMFGEDLAGVSRCWRWYANHPGSINVARNVCLGSLIGSRVSTPLALSIIGRYCVQLINANIVIESGGLKVQHLRQHTPRFLGQDVCEDGEQTRHCNAVTLWRRAQLQPCSSSISVNDS